MQRISSLKTSQLSLMSANEAHQLSLLVDPTSAATFKEVRVFFVNAGACIILVDYELVVTAPLWHKLT
jgi:hypothetical protein